MGLGRLELPTSRLSGVRSNQLSYRPPTLGLQVVPCRIDIWHNYLTLTIGYQIAGKEPRRLTFGYSTVLLHVELSLLFRKEVIQPQVPLRLPCYDFTPITDHTLGICLSYEYELAQ